MYFFRGANVGSEMCCVVDSCDVTYAYSVGHCLYVMFPFYWGALNVSPLTGCFFTARITHYLVLYLTYLYLITLLLYVNNYYLLLFRQPFLVNFMQSSLI